MSKKHPLIVVTGSSGAGTSSVKQAFQQIFIREGLKPAIIEGDSFHKYNRVEMRKEIRKADRTGQTFSHFGAQANLFKELEDCFEVSHEPTRQRERPMRRFKTAGQAQRFLTVHGAVGNLFRLGRHVIRATHYREFRLGAFSQWRQMTCA